MPPTGDAQTLLHWDGATETLVHLLSALPGGGTATLAVDRGRGTLCAGTRPPGGASAWAEGALSSLGLTLPGEVDGECPVDSITLPGISALVHALRGVSGLPGGASLSVQRSADGGDALKLVVAGGGGRVEHVLDAQPCGTPIDEARAQHESIHMPGASFELSAAPGALPHLARLASRTSVSVSGRCVAFSARAPLVSATVSDASARTGGASEAEASVTVSSGALAAAVRASRALGAAVSGAALPGAELVLCAARPSDDVRVLYRLPAVCD